MTFVQFLKEISKNIEQNTNWSDMVGIYSDLK